MAIPPWIEAMTRLAADHRRFLGSRRQPRGSQADGGQMIQGTRKVGQMQDDAISRLSVTPGDERPKRDLVTDRTCRAFGGVLVCKRALGWFQIGSPRSLMVTLGLLLAAILSTVAESQTPPDSGAAEPQAVGGVAMIDPGTMSKVAAAGDMIGFSHADGSGSQTITIVHTGKSWMAVYHIDRSGTIRLVSSRPIDADFSLQLNATSPLPQEIRQLGRR